MSEVTELRNAILGAQLNPISHGEEPVPGTLYVPPSHIKALKLEASVVIGGRGVGKTFWTSALQSPQLRKTIGLLIPELDGLKSQVGFSTRESVDYPNQDSFHLLLDKAIDPYDIWRAVILRWVAKETGNNIPKDNWEKTITWLKSEPEAASNLMLGQRDWKGLIVFDALDRTSHDWKKMDEIVRGLLRTLLWLKSFSGLYGKVFLREDQAERTVFNFPDAAKLQASKAELSWARHDLHGLLWQWLINAQGSNGLILRNALTEHVGIELSQREETWFLPDDMKRDNELQRKAFAFLAGPWMGNDPRRGVPYTWSVSHLSDGRGLTSPRSFLAAINQATEDSLDRYPQHTYALHYESIKRGILQASDIRVNELAEDFPWIKDVMSPLSGVTVPCEYLILEERWTAQFPLGPSGIESDRLPAQHAERGWDGIRQDLQRLGLIETKKDGRIDMPDLYRVGFKLGRRGGVKPSNR